MSQCLHCHPTNVQFVILVQANLKTANKFNKILGAKISAMGAHTDNERVRVGTVTEPQTQMGDHIAFFIVLNMNFVAYFHGINLNIETVSYETHHRHHSPSLKIKYVLGPKWPPII